MLGRRKDGKMQDNIFNEKQLLNKDVIVYTAFGSLEGNVKKIIIPLGVMASFGALLLKSPNGEQIVIDYDSIIAIKGSNGQTLIDQA